MTMRILLITASFPYPPASGGAIRTYGILQGLHAAGHDITLLGFDDREDIAPDETPLAAFCSQIELFPPPKRNHLDRLRDLILTRQSDIEGRLFSTTFAHRLRKLLHEADYDLIQFEGIEVAIYLSLVRQMGTGASLIYDAFNAEAELQRVIFAIDRREMKRWPAALYSWIQAQRITRFERAICQQADGVIAVSTEDASLLSAYRPDGHVHLLSSGIFVDHYNETSTSRDPGKNTLVFTGKMDYRPNVDAMIWFATAILPLIERQIPDVSLTIVGQKPHPRLNSLHDRPNITLTGWVNSVEPYLKAASVYVAPLRMGSGTRLKILEAMASGCAIVATMLAAAGLQIDAKEAMIIADSETDMAKAVTMLLKDPARRHQLGEAARAQVKAHYDWSVLIPRLLAIYKELGLG